MGRSAHCSHSERNIIQNLRKSGKTYSEIAAIVKCSINMVSNAIRYKKSNENRGNKRKTTPAIDRKIVMTSKNDPFLSSKDIVRQLNLDIASSTVRKRLIQHNLHGRIARKVPYHSKKHLEARKKFAVDHRDWNGPNGIKKWRNILWSDESKMHLRGSDGKLFIRRPINEELSPKYTKKTTKHGGGGIMVWGSFSWNGVGPIHWIKDYPMTQDIYMDIMQNVMLPYAEENMPIIWSYQQDNDPKHTAKRTKAWFNSKKINLMEWPAQSPDLNPIENLWKEVKVTIGRKKMKNKEELWQEVRSAWESISVDKCRNLINSMPNRCVAVLKNNGHATKY